MHAHTVLVAAVSAFWLATFIAFAWIFGVWLPRSGEPKDPDDDELRPATA